MVRAAAVQQVRSTNNAAAKALSSSATDGNLRLTYRNSGLRPKPVVRAAVAQQVEFREQQKKQTAKKSRILIARPPSDFRVQLAAVGDE